MADPLAELLEGMTPEQIQRFLAMGNIDEEQALLQQQMAMAEALREPGGDRATGMGAGIGAVANTLGGLVGGLQSKDVMGKMQANVGRRTEGRMDYVQALIDQLRREREGQGRELMTPEAIALRPFMGGGGGGGY